MRSLRSRCPCSEVTLEAMAEYYDSLVWCSAPVAQVDPLKTEGMSHKSMTPLNAFLGEIQVLLGCLCVQSRFSVSPKF